MALATRLATIPDARVLRNAVVPERIPDGGLIIVRDGDPGEPDVSLGGFDAAYYAHSVEVEVFVSAADDAARDARFDDLLTAVGAILDGDRRLGGLSFGMTVSRPEVATEPVQGSSAIKTATLRLVIDYDTPSALG